MGDIDQRTCLKCDYWWSRSRSDDGFGQCRRNSPNVFLTLDPYADADINTLWPQTFSSDWCGDFAPMQDK